MPRWRRPSEEQVRAWQPRFWARLLILVVLAAYVLGFILENRKQVHLHFVLFTARVSLIWLILWILAIGIVAGALLRHSHRRGGAD